MLLSIYLKNALVVVLKGSVSKSSIFTSKPKVGNSLFVAKGTKLPY